MGKSQGVLLIAFLLFAGRSQAASRDHDLSLCLDVATKIEAGGDVSDKDLGAAHQACGRAEQRPQDPEVKPKLDAAALTITDEQTRRHH
jgi:hypothetical protein